MKIRKILLLSLFSICNSAIAQVGVYTKDPKVSMEIKATDSQAFPANGFLLPRLTVEQLNDDASRYGTDQHGALVYVIDAPGTAGSTTSGIFMPGVYFYDSVTQKWKLTDKLTSLELDSVTNPVLDEFGDPLPGQFKTTYSLKYTNEEDISNTINMDALVESGQTLTSLTYDGALHQLIYTDEAGLETIFNLVDLVGDVQTLTTLSLDIDNKRLIYTDENEDVHSFNLAPIIQEPWYSTTTNTGATSNTDNIYTQGWVGIGYSSPSTAPNEKLRVNGAISAVNNYYADYVFEDYFEGFSKIKSDYKFMALEEIDNFIQVNKHLPGITPITKLQKTAEGYAFNVSELSIQLLEKTEELYLHTIEQDNRIKTQEKQIKELQMQLLRLEQLMKSN